MRKSYFEERRGNVPHVGTALSNYEKSEQIALLPPEFRLMLEVQDVQAAIQRDMLPIPATVDREGYYDNGHLAYWLSGYQDVANLVNLGFASEDASNVLDFGGASGRVSRHIASRFDKSRVTIAELNVNHVAWVESNFDDRFTAVKIGPYPHIPFADGTFSFCCAFSVFTHMDAYETTLLAEINRVLRPGGRAFVTIHSEHTWDILPSTYVYQVLRQQENFKTIFKPGTPMPFDLMAFEYNRDTIEYSCNTFISTERVRQHWNKWFEIESITYGAHGYQTGVMMRRRS